MKSLFCFLITLWGSLALVASAQAQTLKIPAFARPQITAPQINLPASRPRITTPTLSSPNLTPQNTINFPTVNTPVSVPSFPNVNTVGTGLIQSPQTINFPSQTLPTQFFPASIISPNNLNSTLPLAVIVPQFPNFQPNASANSLGFLNALLGATSPSPFPNVTPTSNQLQLVPTLITFPKQNPQISLPTLSNLTDTRTLPTVTQDLSSDGTVTCIGQPVGTPCTTVGVGLRIVAPSPPAPQPIISKNSFTFTLPSGFENTGGSLTLD